MMQNKEPATTLAFYRCGNWSLDKLFNLSSFPRQFMISHQFSLSVISDSLWPHGLQHARPPCPSPTPRAYSNSCPLSWWCHPTISSSVVPFSSCLRSFPESGSSPMRQFFASGGQSIEVSVSVLPMNIQDWYPMGQCKARVYMSYMPGNCLILCRDCFKLYIGAKNHFQIFILFLELNCLGIFPLNFYFIYLFRAVPHGMQDLSSPTKDQTCAKNRFWWWL